MLSLRHWPPTAGDMAKTSFTDQVCSSRAPWGDRKTGTSTLSTEAEHAAHGLGDKSSTIARLGASLQMTSSVVLSVHMTRSTSEGSAGTIEEGATRARRRAQCMAGGAAQRPPHPIPLESHLSRNHCFTSSLLRPEEATLKPPEGSAHSQPSPEGAVCQRPRWPPAR